MDQESEALINDIVEWLKTNPQDEDIYFYYSHLPAEYVDLVEEAGLEAINREIFLVNRFFDCAGASDFYTKINFFDQLQLLRFLASLSDNPEEKSKIVDKYPNFVSLVKGKNLNGIEKISKEFVVVWESVVMFLSCSSYIETRTYAKTIMGTFKTSAEIERNKEEIKRLKLFLVKNVESDYMPVSGELEGYARILKGFGFLPAETIDRLINRSRDQYLDTDWDILDNILDALIMVNTYGLERTKSNFADFCKSLWMYYALDVEERLVMNYEAIRVKYYAKPSEDIVRVTEYFGQIWVNEKVFSGEAERRTLEYMQGLNEAQLKVFSQFFKFFILDLFHLNTLLEGFNLDYIFYRLEKSVSQTQFTGIVSEVISAVEDRQKKELVSKYLYSIYRVVHYERGGKPLGGVNTYSNQTQSIAYNILHKNQAQIPTIQSINDLVRIFTKENILNGQADTLLRQYYSQHSQEDRKSFAENVEKFLKSSLEVSTIMHPVVVPTLIDTIKALPGAQKVEYCKKVLAENSFSDRQVAEKMLQILINLF